MFNFLSRPPRSSLATKEKIWNYSVDKRSERSDLNKIYSDGTHPRGFDWLNLPHICHSVAIVPGLQSQLQSSKIQFYESRWDYTETKFDSCALDYSKVTMDTVGTRWGRKRERGKNDGMIRRGWKDQRKKRISVCSLCPLVTSGLLFHLDVTRKTLQHPSLGRHRWSSRQNRHFSATAAKLDPWGYLACISGQTRELNEVQRDLCSGFTSHISAGHALSLYNGTMDYALRPHMKNIKNKT